MATVLCVVGLLTACGVGCGGRGESTRTIPRNVALVNFTRIGIGAPVDEVLNGLGPPISTTSEGNREELNYGPWQIVVNDGIVERKTIVRRPPPSNRRTGKVSAKEILGLARGLALRSVQRLFGAPEARYESWEGRNERVAVLRYGEWQLTFVDGRLTQRER